MEQMVRDPDIKKVALICDRIYAEKANDREGGVGTETQIISKEVYEAQDQNKFVAVVTEKDDLGKPYVPIYYQSRVYIDLSQPDTYAENFERLQRWIFDKPLYVKPKRGKVPDFLTNENPIQLGTTYTFNRAISAIKGHKPFAEGAIEDFLSTFIENLEEFRIVSKDKSVEFDERVVTSIQSFLPYRDQFIQLVETLCRYDHQINYAKKFHRFFENFYPFTEWMPHLPKVWGNCDFDNFIFMLHELFLYTIAILLKYEKFEQAEILLNEEYFIAERGTSEKNRMATFREFSAPIDSLDHRAHRLESGRVSPHADLFEARNASSGIPFRYLMQADFVLYIRSEVSQTNLGRWWPVTLLFVGHFGGAFEIFARSSSKSYFKKTRGLICVDTPADLKPLFDAYKDGTRKPPTWGFHSISPDRLLGLIT